MTDTLLIRADASAQIGTGHVMRCLALAQAWQDIGGISIFAMAMRSPTLEARIRSEGMDFYYINHRAGSKEDAMRTSDLARLHNAYWVVIDGYHFGVDYQISIQNHGILVLVIDDYAHLKSYPANLILNQSSAENIYQNISSPHATILLGPKYALIRREFHRFRRYKKQISEVATHLLITMGGADPEGYILQVIEAINRIETTLNLTVLVGRNSKYCDTAKGMLQAGCHKGAIVVNASDVPALIAQADMAVTSGGTTVWELLFMGTPIVVGVIAHNQEAPVSILAEKEAVKSIGWLKDRTNDEISEVLKEMIWSKSMRMEMASKASCLVDGSGASRVVEVLQSSVKISSLERRPKGVSVNKILN